MILDPCCGSKMFWFDKSPDGVIFGDLRKESHTLCDGRALVISPMVQLDFTALPFGGQEFSMVVFDPPHLINLGDASWTALKYGKLTGDWRSTIRAGFAECFRVLEVNGVLIFKWNEDQIKVSELVQLAEHKPLFGHKSGRNSKTHWLTFIKPEPPYHFNERAREWTERKRKEREAKSPACNSAGG